MSTQPEALVQQLLDDPLDYCSYTIDECRVLQAELRRLHAEVEQYKADAERDPLQGAVDWLLEAHGGYFCVATVQRTLCIGYNRAKHLCDAARKKEGAA